MYYIGRDYVHFGKIDALMRDHMIEDISADGVGVPLYIWHREYESIPTNIVFRGEAEIDSFVTKLAYVSGRHISIASPMVDASLPDGSRVQLTYGHEVTRRGSTFTIRRFRADPLTISDLISFGTVSSFMGAYFWYLIERKMSCLIGGGTASGKTTSLNALSMFIVPDFKVVSIEDSVLGESEIIAQSEGKLQRTSVGKLVDSFLAKHRGIDLRGKQILRIPKSQIKVYSMDSEGKIALRPVSQLIRHRTRKTVFEIHTRTGKKIGVTQDHSLFTLSENGNTVPIRVADIKPGHFIAIPRNLSDIHNDETEILLTGHLGQLEGLFLKGEPVKHLAYAAKPLLFRMSRDHPQRPKYWMKHGLLPCHVVTKLSAAGYRLNRRELDRIRLGSSSSEITIPARIPLDSNFLTFIGLWLSEGSYDINSVIISNADRECREVVRNVAERLGLKARPQPDGVSLIMHSHALKRVMTSVLDLRGVAQTKRVPSWIFNLSNKQIGDMLRGYFSGDGSVSGFEVDWNSSSLGLLKDMATLLSRFGIVSTMRLQKEKDGTYRARVSSVKMLKAFLANAGFLQKSKQEKLRVICQGRPTHDKTDIIPISQQTLRKLRELVPPSYHFRSYFNRLQSKIGRDYLARLVAENPLDGGQFGANLRALAFSDVFWDKVTRIRRMPSRPRFVYDLSVPGCESFVCENIVAHNTAELNLPHENWIASVARTGFGSIGSQAEISLFDLLKAAMRQRPDYIIVGEVRGSEAYTLFQSMATGHGGLSSMHADSVTAAIHRLESEPMNIPATLIMTLDIIAMQMRVRVAEHSTRRMTHLAELVRIDPVSKEILINDVFKWEPKTDSFAYSGRSYVLEKIVDRHGISMDVIKKELDRRKTVLDWIVKSGVRRYTDVSSVIRDYYADPTKLYEKARLGLMG
jgi:type IV secretory pathway ATPase VirB11/archaellum biosynthesis ATPase/intein/homing endonuclease